MVMSTEAPGPRGLPWLGSPWMIGRNPLQNLPRLVREYGDVVRVQVAGREVYFVAHPDDVEMVLQRYARQTIKDDVTRELSEVLGNGLLTSEGAFWKRQRRSIAPAFRPRQVAGYADEMVDLAHQHLDSLPEGRRDFHHTTTGLTLDILVRTVFGEDPGDVSDRVGELTHELMAAFVTEQRTGWRFLPDWIPAEHRRRVDAARNELDAMILGFVERARKRDGNDLLCALIAARDEDGQGMTDIELRDELITLMLAGHETTAISLAMAAWLLAEHPELQQRARDEVDQVLKGARPTMASVRALPFLSAVIDETLRLYPPAWAIARQTTEPLVVGGCEIDKDARLIMSPWLTHRDPRFWVGPTRFRPDRWLNGETEGLPRMAWMPYGGGRRICVGNHFAKMEMVLVLAVLLQQRTLQTAPGFEPELLPAVTLRPTNGIELILRRR